MIQVLTDILVADNSGAKLVSCIKVLGGSNHYIASIGDIILVSVLSAIPSSKIKKKSVQHAVIVRTKKTIKRYDGSLIKFDENAVVLINKNREPIGSRVFGPIARELRYKGYMKVISLASEVL